MNNFYIELSETKTYDEAIKLVENELKKEDLEKHEALHLKLTLVELNHLKAEKELIAKRRKDFLKERGK